MWFPSSLCVALVLFVRNVKSKERVVGAGVSKKGNRLEVYAGDTVAKIQDQMLQMVVHWFKATDEATKLQVLSQRFNRRLSRLGVELRDAVSSDSRMVWRATRRGGWMIAPLKELNQIFPSPANQVTFWKGMGCPGLYTSEKDWSPGG